MECLIQVNGTQLESLATLYSDHDEEIDEEMTNMRKDSALLTIARSRNAAGPSYEVTQENLYGLREALGLVRHRRKIKLMANCHSQFLTPTTECPT